MFGNIDFRFDRRSARRRQCTVRRGFLAICAALALSVPLNSVPAAAEDFAATPGDTNPGSSLANRLGEIAGTVYDKVEKKLVAPSRQAAEEVLADPRTQTMYRHLSETAQDLEALADTHVIQPISRESPGLIGEIQRSYQAVGAIAGDCAEKLRGWVLDPLIAKLKRIAYGAIMTPSAPRDGAPSLASAADPPLLASAVPGLSDSDILRNLTGNDPLEPVNRFIFRLNGGLQAELLDPVSRLYLDHTTPGVQAGIGNFFSNLREPATVVSSALEGQLDDAGTAAARFGINTTLGVAGLRDRATELGFTVRARNLEETLCVYELPAGPYVVLPLLGPATLRDAAGRIATNVMYFEVMGASVYVPYRLTAFAVQYELLKDKMNIINSLSIDPYVVQKALYLAMRELSCEEQAAIHREFFTK
jgi:phospholipid-binding lipoprotein MlaA